MKEIILKKELLVIKKLLLKRNVCGSGRTAEADERHFVGLTNNNLKSMQNNNGQSVA